MEDLELVARLHSQDTGLTSASSSDLMWLVYTIASAVVSLALLARVAGRIVISWVARSQAMVNGIERAPPLAPPAPAQQPASRPMLAKLRQSAFYAIDQGQLNLLRAAIKLTDANGARLDLDALVDYNVDYNVKHSLLHLAVRRQKVECVRCLLAAGASPLVLSQGSPQLRQLPLRTRPSGATSRSFACCSKLARRWTLVTAPATARSHWPQATGISTACNASRRTERSAVGLRRTYVG